MMKTYFTYQTQNNRESIGNFEMTTQFSNQQPSTQTVVGANYNLNSKRELENQTRLRSAMSHTTTRCER